MSSNKIILQNLIYRFDLSCQCECAEVRHRCTFTPIVLPSSLFSAMIASAAGQVRSTTWTGPGVHLRRSLMNAC